jgi:hypothetical protein
MKGKTDKAAEWRKKMGTAKVPRCGPALAPRFATRSAAANQFFGFFDSSGSR